MADKKRFQKIEIGAEHQNDALSGALIHRFKSQPKFKKELAGYFFCLKRLKITFL